MSIQGEINGDTFMVRHRCAANLGIPECASVPRTDPYGPSKIVPQSLQMIQKAWVMPIGAVAIPTTAPARELTYLEVLPPPIGIQLALGICN